AFKHNLVLIAAPLGHSEIAVLRFRVGNEGEAALLANGYRNLAGTALLHTDSGVVSGAGQHVAVAFLICVHVRSLKQADLDLAAALAITAPAGPSSASPRRCGIGPLGEQNLRVQAVVRVYGDLSWLTIVAPPVVDLHVEVHVPLRHDVEV